MRKLLLLALLAAALPAAAQQSPPLALDGLGRATMPVDGAWQFHLGDDPAWASPAFDDSAWQPIEAGRTWEEQGYPGHTGFAWYRRHLMLAENQSPDWNLALFLPNVEDACEVYWNGVPVGSNGRVPPHPVWYWGVAPQAIVLGKAQSGVLAIRVWKSPRTFASSPVEGGLVAVPQLGNAQAVAGLLTAERYRWLRSRQYTLALALLSGVVGVLALVSWLRNRRRTMLLWLALAMVFPLVLLLVFEIPGLVPFRFSYGLIGPMVSLNDTALWFLLIALLGLNDRPRLVRLAVISAVASFALNLADSANILLFHWDPRGAKLFLLGDIGLTIPAVLLEFFGLVLVFSAFRKRLDAARWILAISALLDSLLQGAFDLGGLGTRWTHWTFAPAVSGPLFTIAGNTFTARTITSTLLLFSILYAAWRYSAEQNERQSSMEQELRSAQELQQVLIPDTLPALAGYSVTSAYRPAQEVGGDFFQVIARPDGSALLILGDVSGKGLKAAMAVSLIVGALRTLAEFTPQPAEMLAGLNRRLYGRLHGGFATCLVLLLESDGTCVLANAGHPAPFLNDREIEQPGALPLGLVPDAAYEETAVHLEPGDYLALYTDGLLEAQTADGELFSFERLRSLVSERPTADRALAVAQSFGQQDDITVLTLTRLAIGQESSTQLSAPRLAPA